MRNFILIFIALLIISGTIGYIVYQQNQPLEVETYTVKSSLMKKEIVAEGIFLPSREKTVFSPTTGKIEEVLKKTYQNVNNSDVVIKIKEAGTDKIVEVSADAKGTLFPATANVTTPAFSIAEKVMPVVQGQPLFIIKDLSDLYFLAGIAEVDLSNLEIKDKATITPKGYSDTDINGEIEEIYPEVRTNALGEKSILVKVKITTSQSDLPNFITNTSGNVSIVSSEKNSISIPLESLQKENGDDYVFLVKNDEAKKTRIEVGELFEDMIEITSGLKINDEIITDPVENLKDGQNIQVE